MKLAAKISDEGALLMPDRAMLTDWLHSNKGKAVILEIKVRRKQRSNDQNAYMWGVVVPIVCGGLRHLGHDVDEQDTHEFLKARFNSKKIVNIDGVVEELPTSTTKLTTSEMMDYIARIQQWAAEYLGLVIPDPLQQSVLILADKVGEQGVIVVEGS